MELSGKILNQIISGKVGVKGLPDILTVNGSLCLTGTPIKELPDNLTVTGSLDLTSTAIKELPENLTVRGWLGLRSTAIKEIPNNLTVHGDIELTRTNIENYPVVYGCGAYGRAIYLSLADKSIIVIGCYRGTEEQAIEKIKGEYSGEDADDYVLKVKQCFSMYKDLQQKNILN